MQAVYTACTAVITECKLEHCVLQLLLRTGIQRSKKAPSALHPYGYMKDKFVWSLISAVGIFCLGAGVTVVHGCHGLFVQTKLEHLTAGLTGLQHCALKPIT